MYVTALVLALVEGAGAVALLDLGRDVEQRLTRFRRTHGVAARRTRRAVTVLGVTILVLSVAALAILLRVAAATSNTFVSDDRAAMDWLRSHAAPGSRVANDSFADAGVWAPFKAGLPVLRPRSQSADPARLEQAQLVLNNIGQLDAVPDARAAACALNVAYVYRGASGTRWEPRHFPSTDELRQASALEEIFSSGNATVFRTRLDCPS
jgi:hypothetical protein